MRSLLVFRFHKLLLYLGINAKDCQDMKVHQFCKIISEFALEYRTTREKVIQQHNKKKNYKERKKTRGKLIVDVWDIIMIDIFIQKLSSLTFYHISV